MTEPTAPKCIHCGADWFHHGGMPHDFEDAHGNIASEQREPLYLDAEVVICAAVLATTGEVIRCHRHHDGLRALADRQLEHAEDDRAQGFVTSRGRYVDRYEALELQLAEGVKSAAPGGYRGKQLFSEDLY